MFEKEPEDWRELLSWITSDSVGMQRVIQELGVRDITIRRWIKGESEPRPQNLRRLVSALPEHRERLLELFSEAFEDFSELSFSEASHQEIPAKFYVQIFQMRGTISPTQRYWSIANAVISQALSQLDPENLGMAITVVRCMVSERYKPKVVSLRESVGQATSPWPGNLEQQALFLGVESLAGYVVSTCHPFEVQNYKEDKESLPGHQFEMEQSAAAHPILYAGRIAGCLLVSSIEPYFFLQPARLNLVADYAHLISLAFAPEDFIDPSLIELRLMPLHAEQKAYFKNFRKRLTDARLKLYNRRDIDAEQYVWEEIEDEIFSRWVQNESPVPQP
jgi:hypothetical protein